MEVSLVSKVKVAILGSGNIATDLMYKILKRPEHMELALVSGIILESDGLARARSEGVPTSHHGIQAILDDPDIRIVFDATSAKAHVEHAKQLKANNRIAIDLTPAAVGPFVVPPVNLGEQLDAPNVNMISCGGQASIPLIHAISSVAPVVYAELISTTASRSVGPGTRHNIDEFTYTTARAIEAVGGARQARALPVINPADPPLIMSNTVYAVMEEGFDAAAVFNSVKSMVAEVQGYVPGYRLKAEPFLDERDTPWGHLPMVIVLNQVEGAGDYLPKYAGNLDIMTASAWRVGQLYAQHQLQTVEGRGR
jgi:acetaldehyde dehydrogenase